MEMINGYVFLDLTKSNVYAKALKVLGADKPVVIKDSSGAPYFVDSLALDGTNVVITKGGKTITIANDNTITVSGDVTLHYYQIYLTGRDNNNKVIYIYASLYTYNNNLNKDNILDYLKTITADETLAVSGYDYDDNSPYIIVGLLWDEDDNSWTAENSTDSSVTVTFDMEASSMAKVF